MRSIGVVSWHLIFHGAQEENLSDMCVAQSNSAAIQRGGSHGEMFLNPSVHPCKSRLASKPKLFRCSHFPMTLFISMNCLARIDKSSYHPYTLDIYF